ncbi:DUF2288 domain-containing protein [Pseudomonas sp. JZ134]|uniref:DUF2288 domain-containing protein n=2 Tax=Pseudomonas TaxID=286 RepID=A0ABS0MVN7_PSELU|nr:MULTISPECIES: DUF2288 domain-containing protein [Pseudomonas]MBH3440754.1 DUF2288 domain-containing protein [Pseudomonas luteola]
MMSETSTLYATLLGQTAEISWQELQPHFAKGSLLRVDAEIDLIEAAEAIVQDNTGKVSAWLTSGQMAKVTEDEARGFLVSDPVFWAVVVAPWVLIQARNGNSGEA